MATPKPKTPLDRRIAIMDMYDAGAFIGPKSAEDLVGELGGTVRGMGVALRELGFRIARRETKRRVRTGQGRRTQVVRTPRTWAPPDEWTDKAVKQRQLRRQGASPAFCKAIFQSAPVPLGVLDESMSLLAVDGIPVTRPGALKKAIAQVTAEREARYSRDIITTNELAEVLREAPDLPKQFYLNRAAGLLRAATRGR